MLSLSFQPISILVFVSTMLCSCAVNRVSQVYSSGDTWSIYRVPVVYGIGDKNGIAEADMSPKSIDFAEYDAKEKEGTGSCLGTLDRITLIPEKNVVGKMRYEVLMVPPGDYAYFSFGLSPHEGDVYFHVEGNNALYLGNFRLEKYTYDEKYKWQAVRVLPTEYDDAAAKAALSAYGIDSDRMKRAKFILTDGHAEAFLCTP